MIDPNAHVITKGDLETCRILMTNHFKFLEDRVKTERRIKELSGQIDDEDLRNLENLISNFNRFENSLICQADYQLHKFPIWNYFLSKVSDLDRTTALALIVGIEDISRFEIPKKLWAYCGMHSYMVDVNTQKRWFETKQNAIDFVTPILRNKGSNNKFSESDVDELLRLCVWGSGYVTKKIAAKDGNGKLENWNKFLKKICIRISDRFDQGSENGFYHQQLRKNELKELKKMSAVKDHNFESIWLADPQMRLNLERQLPKGTLAKANSRARRDTIRLFLTHLLQYWWQLKGVPTKKPRVGKNNEIIEFPSIPLEFRAV